MNQKGVPRLKDVAEAANVSVSAASKILRGDQARFGADTCQRVIDAAKALGWRRNLLVSGIQTGRTKTIGVMIPPYDSFWVNVLSGIHRRLAEADYLPITVWQGDLGRMPHFEVDEKEGARQINRLLDRRVDALIMWPAFGVAYQDHLVDLAERNLPVVVIDYRSDPPFGDTVTTNETQAAKMVAKHLLDLGHRRIACISSRETKSQTWAWERRQEFERAVQVASDAEVKSWRLNRTGTDGLEVATKLLTDPFRPTAVFAVSDHEAMHVYDAAVTLGLSIPQDLSVVGFADLDFSSHLVPPLTTVRQRPDEIGVKAASLVLDRLEGRSDGGPSEQARIDADLILRDSSAPPAR
ncbi:Ribose operon repressor [Posidoniimonas polymericola]|uniref:Ribose operon repressor n=1 Tax=Posidoniimonas polymericola TaxID=2528002 RepID=A0A5C5YL34_9BACT|nr:LacI family DNA-binding transcriptional regulator [Posidoniimonas polymericola]TWT75643.1 Ribose operon repressor [Posidoniimonas polymericola]